MAVDWPSHLVERIAANQWVLFIGSGISASCKNGADQSPPTWRELLSQLAELITVDDVKDVAHSLIASGQLLAAADHIRFTLDQQGGLNSYLTTIKRAVEGPQGDPFQPSELYEDLLALDPRVVFTTNYDKLFEIASKNGYSMHMFSSTGLGGDLRRGTPVLVKLHGSTDSIAEVILTRTDFTRGMKEGRPVLEILNALSLTTTILFVGYSLDDPDIQLALHAVGRGPLDPEAHFMLSPAPTSASRIPVFRENYGVTILTYPAGAHDEVHASLVDLASQVEEQRSLTSMPVS
jgi:hypothetical protein